MTYALAIELIDWLAKVCAVLAAAYWTVTLMPHAKLGALAVRCALVIGLVAPLALLAPSTRAVAVPISARPPDMVELTQMALVRVEPVADATIVVEPAQKLSAPEVAAKSNLQFWLVLPALWAMGASLVILSFLRSLCLLDRAFRLGASAPAIDARVGGLARRMGVRGRVEVRITDAVASPCAFGLFRPRILMPTRLAGASDAVIDAMAAHELAHIRAGDPCWLAVARLTCALHWFNPLVWALDRRHREIIETVCDSAVLEARIPLSDYAQALVDAASTVVRDNGVSQAAVSMRGRDIHARLQHLMREGPCAPRIGRGTRSIAYGASASALALLASVNLVAAQDAGPPPLIGGRPAVMTSTEDCGCTDAPPVLENADLPRLTRAQLNERGQLEALVRTGSPAERASAILALGDWPRAGVEGFVLPALRDQDPRVRAAAQSVLAKWADDGDYEAIAAGLDDPSCRVSTASARGLSRLGDRRALQPLLGAARSPACGKRLAAAGALASFPTPESASALRTALDDPDSRVRETAIRSLAAVGDGQVVQTLLTALRSDPHDQVRSAAAWAFKERELGVRGDDAVIAGLIEALRDSDGVVRQGAAYALGRVGDIRAQPALLSAAAEDNKHVRVAAIEALGRFGDIQAQPVLLAGLTDSQPHVRLAAVDALGRIGDARARPAVERLLDDPDINVSNEAAQTLQQLSR